MDTYYYRIDEYNGENLIASGSWDETEETGVTVNYTEGDELTEGHRYAFTVKALFEPEQGQTTGVESAEYGNHGTIIDTTAPDFSGNLVTPYACDMNNLAVSWSAEDTISGIHRVEAFLRTFNEQNELVEIGRVNLVPQETGDRVLLTSSNDGDAFDIESGTKVYVTLRITNGAGIPIDRTSPGGYY